MTYRVTAPYVTLKVSTDLGETVLGYYKDALVPDRVDADDLARHIRKGMVEKLESAEERDVARQKAEAEKADEHKVDDKADAATIKQAEADKAKADAAVEKEDAATKAAGRVPVKAADSKPGAKTATGG